MSNKDFTTASNLERTASAPRSLFVSHRQLLSEEVLSERAAAPRFQSMMRSAK